MEIRIIKKLFYLFSRKWFYLFFVPVILFLFGLVFSVYHIVSYDTYFTVMPIVQEHEASINIPRNQLVDGTPVTGEFKASDNNLGAVALRIKDLNAETVSDNFHIYFRIKEQGEKTWYSSNSYKGGQFHDLDLFPFGFPLIANSKNKIYTVELYSKGATSENALTIDTRQKIVGEYLLQKSDLKKPANALRYIEGKLIYLFHNIGGVFSVLVYFLPLYGYFYLLAEKERTGIPFWVSVILFIPFIRKAFISPFVTCINYLLRLLYKGKIIEEYKPVQTIPSTNILLFFVILVDIFLIDKTNNFLLFIILVFWGLSLELHKLRIQSSFLLAGGFLLLSLLLLLVHLDSFAEQSAIWAYLFLVIGVMHTVIILRLAKKKKA